MTGQILTKPGAGADGRKADRAAGAAAMLQPLARQIFGGDLPVRLRAWDGSEAGPDTGPVIVLRSPLALRRLMWHPGELGLAQAYVAGELDVEGDITDGLRSVWRAIRERGTSGRRPASRLPASGWLTAARTAIALRVPGPRPPAPTTQARIGGRLHSRSRDSAAISHHYDVPARFYQLLLDPAMAYSCALWTSGEPGYTLADAQRDKLDAICRKLLLGPGQRLLDVGCGWGSLSVHAAGSYGADVTAVTLASEQARFVRERLGREGIAGKVAVHNRDYRDIPAGQHDAVASVEMGEHVGDREYPAFCAQLYGLLKPGGRLLIQQMSRGGVAPGGGKFIESYIAPDMHMRPAGETIRLLEDAGFEVLEVQSMRADYTRTIRAWLATFEARIDEVTALLGEESARVWRLYLAGSALAFDESRMGVHQILAVKPPS
jgi:cyclopropane-fatty-acyl-phospholipid synthase